MGVVGFFGDVVHLASKVFDAFEDKPTPANWQSTTTNYYYYGPVVIYQYNYYQAQYVDENGNPIYVQTASQQYIHPQSQYLPSVQNDYAALPPAETVEYVDGDYVEADYKTYEDENYEDEDYRYD